MKHESDKRPSPAVLREQPGYYPGYSTLAQQHFWDEKTREVVLKRVYQTPPIRFFDAKQARVLEAVCDHVIPQDDRVSARRIPIVPRIDQRLFEGKSDGYRYEDMPPDQEAYRLGLEAIDLCAKELGKGFVELPYRQQEEVMRSLHDNRPFGAHEIWKKMSLHHFWLMLTGDCVEAYYAHPWAWDEIGFGGPAYPRGYFRLERGDPEPWEVNEKRYSWEAPAESLSDLYEPIPSAIESHPNEPRR